MINNNLFVTSLYRSMVWYWTKPVTFCECKQISLSVLNYTIIAKLYHSHFKWGKGRRETVAPEYSDGQSGVCGLLGSRKALLISVKQDAYSGTPKKHISIVWTIKEHWICVLTHCEFKLHQRTMWFLRDAFYRWAISVHFSYLSIPYM